MKILCIAYRNWALEIYSALEKIFQDYEFIIINSKKSYLKFSIYDCNPDLILWYGWSDIIDQNIIKNYYSVMLHPSPLPKYRGGSPIQNQIINGEKMSAVTLFKMNDKIDQGDIIFQKSFSLEGELKKVLSEISLVGIELSKKMISNFKNLKLTKQDHNNSSFFERRNPNQSEITLEELKNSTSIELYNKIRALQDPYPNSYIKCKDGKKLYITQARIENND